MTESNLDVPPTRARARLNYSKPREGDRRGERLDYVRYGLFLDALSLSLAHRQRQTRLLPEVRVAGLTERVHPAARSSQVYLYMHVCVEWSGERRGVYDVCMCVCVCLYGVRGCESILLDIAEALYIEA